MDVGDGLAHELATVGSGGEKRGSGRRLVRQTVVHRQRLGVGVGIGRGAEIAAAQPVVLGPSGKILAIVLRAPGAEVLARGMEQAVAVFYVGVHMILPPRSPIEIDVEDEQPVAWTTVVQARLPAVLQKIVLVAVASAAHQIGLAAFAQGFHALNAGGFRQFLGHRPA